MDIKMAGQNDPRAMLSRIVGRVVRRLCTMAGPRPFVNPVRSRGLSSRKKDSRR